MIIQGKFDKNNFLLEKRNAFRQNALGPHRTISCTNLQGKKAERLSVKEKKTSKLIIQTELFKLVY